MNKIKTVKIRNEDGTISEESYSLTADAKDIDMKNGYDLQDTIGNIDVDEDGSIATQLAEIKNINNNIDSINEDIDNINSDITDISTDVTALKSQDIIKYDLSLPSSEFRINQLLGVIKSYYDNRLDDNGDNVFEYGHITALDEEYSNVGEHKREIDCSAFIGLGLRGITFDNSPYHVLASHESDGSDTGGDDDSGQTTPETDDNITNHTDELVLGDYPWALDLAKYKRKLVAELKAVRSASQMCQLFEESGWKIEFAEDFSNIRRGDIIFYAKKDGNDEWVQPNRYKHISHVAIVSSVLDNSEDTYHIGSQYPYKHTLYEVSTFGHIVLNTCLEKRTPNRIVVVCRPRLGSDDYYVSGGASRIQGIGSNVNKMSKPGFMYLTSSTTTGLPIELNNGLGYALKVDVSYNYWGKYYSVVQTLYNTRGTDMYMRTQYCYNNNYKFSDSRWNSWCRINTENVSI